MKKLVFLFGLWGFAFVILYSFQPQKGLIYESRTARYEVVKHDFFRVMGDDNFMFEDVHEFNDMTRLNVFVKELSMSVDLIIRKYGNICQIEFLRYEKKGIKESENVRDILVMSKKDILEFRNYMEENLLAQVDNGFILLDEENIPRLRKKAFLAEYAPFFIWGSGILLFIFGLILIIKKSKSLYNSCIVSEKKQ